MKNKNKIIVAQELLNLVNQGLILTSPDAFWNKNLWESLKRRGFSLYENAKFNIAKDSAVCIRGGLSLSQIRCGFDLPKVIDHKFSKSGYYIFSPSKLLEMEKEYLLSQYGHPYLKRTKEKFCNILENIIANGNFDPKDKTDYLKK